MDRSVEEKQRIEGFPQWAIKRSEPDTGNALPSGFPYIIDEASGQLCQVALLFLATRHVSEDGKTFPKNTVDAYTSDILDWMRFCARFHLPWNKATWADLAKYISSLEMLVSAHHRQRYREATKVRRVVPILQLYKWAPANIPALCTPSPYGSLFDSKKAAEFLDARRRKQRSKVKVAEDAVDDKELPDVMQEEEVRAVLKAIGPPPRGIECDENEEAALTSVGHLGMELGLQAGLRVSEVVTLRVSLFRRYLDIEIVEGAFYRVGKFRRKGGKMKFVRMHGALLQKVVNYIRQERAFAMQGMAIDHGVLLVHKGRCHRGTALRPGTLQRRFAKACMAVGLTRRVSKFSPTDGDWSNPNIEYVELARYTFHCLRHTFAVWRYYARKLDGDPEPWKHIQEELGHEDVETTIKIYLRVTQDFEAVVTDVFVNTLNRDAGVYGIDHEFDEQEVGGA